MSKLVVISLGSGNLLDGFPRVTAQIWTSGYNFPEQVTGSLPPAPGLIDLYRNWQLLYHQLCDRQVLRSSRLEDSRDDGLELDEFCITNVSQASFEELCQQLQTQLNSWLASDGFLNIDRQLRSQLNLTEEIRIVLELNDKWLVRFPWHQWNLLRDYPNTEIALSQPEYRRRSSRRSPSRKEKVRILAILGDSRGIDLAAETHFLGTLTDADITYLSRPSRYEVNTYLWDSRGWDMLFFAGHSQTQGMVGRFYINDDPLHNSITIEQLGEALQAALDRGLKLAIFNSCDGLGLAMSLEALYIPVVIVMREAVPNRVAQEFFRQFLGAFAIERLPLYPAVRQARRKLQGLEDRFPGASWLPVICQNPAVEPPTWLQLGGTPPCPYKGLQTFRETDTLLFFGREQATRELATAVGRQPLVAVVGASGSGKSSLIFAGLIPYLRQHHRSGSLHIVSFRPGHHPFEALVEAVAMLDQLIPEGRDQPSRLQVRERAIEWQQNPQQLCCTIASLVNRTHGSRFVLIADQFEELYSLCPEPDRQSFLDALLGAVESAPAFTLVLTLRADFYGYALSYRPMSDALQGAVYNLGPMSREELRSAIEKPANQMQVNLEPGLTDKLILATGESAGHLPLLEFALSQLWSNQQEGWLTHQAYAAIGGVEAALANHADAVYGQMSQVDRARVQRIFTQLVQPGVGTEASRRIANRDEIGDDQWELVTHLASARLVVTNRDDLTGEETVEVVHEALIRHWERLKQWIQIDSEFRNWQEDLRVAQRRWERSDRDEDLLLRGKALLDACHWYGDRLNNLGSREREFIASSIQVQEREKRIRKRKQQLSFVSLVIGLLGALLLAGMTWWQWQAALLSGIRSTHISAQALLTSQQNFDALIESIWAGSQVSNTVGVNRQIQIGVAETLLQAVSFVKEQNRLEKHGALVEGISFSPDSTLVATGGGDDAVKVWSIDGQEKLSLTVNSDRGIRDVQFSPDGRTIAASWDTTVQLWNLKGQPLHGLKGHDYSVEKIAFSPDGSLMATVSSNIVKLWNLKDQQLKISYSHPYAVNGVAFSSNGQLMATAGDDGTVKLWDFNGQELRSFQGHQERVASVSFSPDGTKMATASGDRTVKLWNLAGEELVSLVGHENGVNQVAFSPDGTLVATASGDKTIKLWNLDGRELETLYGHRDAVVGLTFSPDGQFLASASHDQTAKLWKLNNPYTQIYQSHEDTLFDLAISPGDPVIATAGWDNVVKLWTLDGKELRTLRGHKGRVHRLNFSPDGRFLATPSDDQTVKLWTREGRELQTLRGHQKTVWNASFSPDSRLLATASEDQTVKLWDLEGREVKTLRGHSNVVNSVAFSPDGRLLASAGWDKTVKLWNLEGQELQTLEGHKDGINSVIFSPDGELMATASWDRTVKLWNREGKVLTTLAGHNNAVHSVAFSPDGKLIATASGDSTVKIWSREGEELQTLRGYEDGVWSVRFSPDGKTLVTSSEHKLIFRKLFLQTLDQLLVESCHWVGDYLNHNSNADPQIRGFCGHSTTKS